MYAPSVNASTSGREPLRLEASSPLLEDRQSARIDGVVCPHAAARNDYQPGFAEHLEMMGDGRLLQVKSPHHVADADGRGLRRDQTEDLEPGWLTECA